MGTNNHSEDNSMKIPKLLILAIFVLLLPLGCKDVSTGPEEMGDRVVGGVNLTLLFAPPDSSEIAAVLAEWKGRSPSAQGIEVAATRSLTLGGSPFTVRIVSHRVDGIRHYGALVVPDGAKQASLPIVVVGHGGDNGQNVDDLLQLLPYSLGSSITSSIYVIPAFRSESLTFGGVTYKSEGEPSPWDRDVDDALALLSVAFARVPEADSTRIASLGFSRGACVAMLMAIRNPAIDLVIEFFGPTDFFGPYVQEIAEEALQGKLRDLPGLDYLNDRFIQPLKNGTITMKEVRRELLRRSPVYFTDRMPDLQLHHGTDDIVVYVSQAEKMIEVMRARGVSQLHFESYLYPGGQHNPFTLPGSVERSQAFLARLFTRGSLAGR